MSEQSNVASINYAPNPLNVKRRLNKLVVVSLVGALLCAVIAIALFVTMLIGQLYSAGFIVLPFIIELSIAGFSWRQIRRNREYQCGQSIAVTALALTVTAALTAIYLSATVQDRLGVNDPAATDVLTVCKTWTPPPGARVARTRCMGRFTWFELKMPADALPSFRQAVFAQEGPAASTMSPAASLGHYQQDEDPEWFAYSSVQDPQLFIFGYRQRTDEYIFSPKTGRVLVRQTEPGS